MYDAATSQSLRAGAGKRGRLTGCATRRPFVLGNDRGPVSQTTVAIWYDLSSEGVGGRWHSLSDAYGMNWMLNVLPPLFDFVIMLTCPDHSRGMATLTRYAPPVYRKPAAFAGGGRQCRARVRTEYDR